MNLRALVVAAVLSGQAASLAAHHSIASVYDGSRRMTLEAIVAEFQFVNPHPVIRVDVERDGRVERWTLEMDNRWELAELGFKADTLKPGDRIVVSGSPARREGNRLYVRRLARPSDRFSYQHHR